MRRRTWAPPTCWPPPAPPGARWSSRWAGPAPQACRRMCIVGIPPDVHCRHLAGCALRASRGPALQASCLMCSCRARPGHLTSNPSQARHAVGTVCAPHAPPAPPGSCPLGRLLPSKEKNFSYIPFPNFGPLQPPAGWCAGHAHPQHQPPTGPGQRRPRGGAEVQARSWRAREMRLQPPPGACLQQAQAGPGPGWLPACSWQSHGRACSSWGAPVMCRRRAYPHARTPVCRSVPTALHVACCSRLEMPDSFGLR